MLFGHAAKRRSGRRFQLNPPRRVHQHQYHVARLQRLIDLLQHTAVKMRAGRIHKDNLRGRMHALACRNLHHSGDAVAGGLRLGADNGYLFADQSVEQRAFAGVRPAQYGDKSRFQKVFKLLISIIADSPRKRWHHRRMISAGTTERLNLRPLEMADAPAIQELFPHWEIGRYLLYRMPWPYPPDRLLEDHHVGDADIEGMLK